MIGIDVGYGDVKAVYTAEGSFRYIKQPTAVTYASTNEIAVETTEHAYSFQGRDYIVGDAARYGAFSTRSFDFLKRYSPLFIHHILQMTGFKPSQIATGLPLGLFSKKEELLKELTTAQVNGEPIDAKFSLFPQAVGILLDYRMTEKGSVRANTDKNGLVLDIGFNTIDVLCFENGTAIKADAKTLDKFGISRIILELAAHISRDKNIQLSDQEAKDIFMSGEMSVYGTKIDLSEPIRKITEMYFEEVLNNIKSTWDNRLQRADIMLLAGGGAVTISKYIPTEYKNIVNTPEQPEFANARGYLKGLLAGQKKAQKAD